MIENSNIANIISNFEKLKTNDKWYVIGITQGLAMTAEDIERINEIKNEEKSNIK